MYLITIKNGSGSMVIHEPDTSEIKVDGAQISQEKNCFGSLTFDIYPGNPGYSDILPFATLVTVTNTITNAVEFDGRVINVDPSMDSDGMVCKSVTCEDFMAYLCDSQQSYADTTHYAGDSGKSGLQEFVDVLLAVHNSKVEDYKKIYRGNVTLQTFDTSDGVTKGISRASTWDNISEKLIDTFGGEMRVRRGSDGKLYLDYAERLGTERATRIELGVNLVDNSSEIDPSAVITRLYPYGAKKTVEEEDDEGTVTEVETEERIDITSANDGVPYIDDVVAIEQYGIIEGVQEWDDVTVPLNLLRKAQEWLGDNNAMPVSHSITAYDLSLIGYEFDSFALFDSYPCYNPLTDTDEVLEIVKRTINISEPGDSSIEMGETKHRLSMDIAKPPVMGDVEQIKSELQTSIVNVENKLVAQSASIEVMEDRITQSVTESVSQTITTTVTEQVATATEGITGQIDETAEELKENIGSVATIVGDLQDSVNTSLDDVTGQIAGIDSDLNTIVETVTTTTNRATELEQTVDGWSFDFSILEQTVTEMGDQISTTQSETLKYIRFIDGEIWLGKEPDAGEDDYKVVIGNQRIRFLVNNIEVAYISDQKLYITDAQVTNRLDIGNFAFFPRSNGNLTLRKVR